MLLLVDYAFLMLPFCFLACTLDRMPIFAHQDNTVCKERFFWGVTFSAVKQTIFTVVIFRAFGTADNRVLQNRFNRLYKLSPSAKV